MLQDDTQLHSLSSQLSSSATSLLGKACKQTAAQSPAAWHLFQTEMCATAPPALAPTAAAAAIPVPRLLVHMCVSSSIT